MGIAEVRLYKNTTSTIPIGVYTDVSDQFDLGAGIDEETLSETLTVTGLTAGTKFWFWVQCIDEAGNDSGILPVGSITTFGVSIEYNPGGQSLSSGPNVNRLQAFVFHSGSLQTELFNVLDDIDEWRTFQGSLGNVTSPYRIVFKITHGDHVPDTGINAVITPTTSFTFDTNFEGWMMQNGETFDVNSLTPANNPFKVTNSALDSKNGEVVMVSPNVAGDKYVLYDGSGISPGSVSFFVSPEITL